jgi:hypothetical protein
MKKIIALFLVSIICFTFIACGNNTEEINNTSIDEKKIKAEENIIGTWNTEGGSTITFNSDHTGVLTDYVYGEEADVDNFRWTYNEDMDCYLYTQIDGTPVVSIFLREEGETVCLLTYGAKFYRQDNTQS